MPIENLESDTFSVRWTGQLIPEESGEYRIGLKAKTKGKIYLNDSLRTEFSNEHEPQTGYFDEKLEKGKVYNIKIEYLNNHTDAQAHLIWANKDKDLLKPAIEAAKKSEVVVLFLGLSPEIEGEEMPVVLEGFDKGDRSEIELPKSQIELMKEIQSLGKPTILVLMNGSALAINWAGEHIPAILEAWYPGEFGGRAIADVLFGDYNPAGRLPITFYKSVSDLPDFKSYNMENRTYKYFKGEPLFPFGHGLSYTNFNYQNFTLPSDIIAGNEIPVSVEVFNSGKYDGDEVVQLYVSLKQIKTDTPSRSLVGFKRIHLKVGEIKTVNFNIPPSKYAYINENGEEEIIPGNLSISIGGKQPNIKGIGDTWSSEVIVKNVNINK